MQKKTVAMILSLSRTTLTCVFGLLMLAESVWSQSFDHFLFVGIPGMPTGTVTSLSLQSTDLNNSAGGTVEIGEVSYFDAAGLSTSYTVTATPSAVLNGQTPVYASDDDRTLQLADLHDISFYTAELTHATNNTPPNWFRLTNYQGSWSGAFRVGDQVYSLRRDTASNSNLVESIVEVRTWLSDTVTVSPSLRGKVNAVFDTGYFTNGSLDRQTNQIPALESIHILDGLLSDSLGLTLQLEQIVSANVFDSDTELPTALNWKQQQDLLATDDALATLFFIDQLTNDNAASNNAKVSTDDAIIIQPHSSEYQFAIAHNFGRLLLLSDQTDTLQDWRQTGLVSLPAVHWSQQQRDEFDNNPPVSRLLQVLNNDQAATDDDLLPVPAELDRVLVESDSEERTSLPQNDPVTTINTAASGGGAVFWLYLVVLVFFRLSVRSTTLAR